MRRWSASEVSIEMAPDESGDGIVTLVVTVPGGSLMFMGEPEERGSTLVVRGTHVTSHGVKPNEAGIANLRLIAGAIMEVMQTV